MNRNNSPLSPASAGSNDSSFASRYGNMGPSTMGATSDVPYTGGPYGAARPSQPSPPSSGHPSSSTDASRPSASSGSHRPPSSASSIGGRSDGRMGFAPPNSHRDSTRSTFRSEHEDALQKHYISLRSYLAAHLRDEKGNMKPNRARDKLLRLSVTQFMELSTDVFDELIRREDDRLQRVRDVPRFLPPKQNFHPKRNQARQKLSTLPVERFRQLATDVFFELERRIPRFGNSDMDRMSVSSRAPSRGGMRPPPLGLRGPPPAGGRPPMSPNGMGPPNLPYGAFRPNSPGPNGPQGARSRQPSDASSVGRPLPKAFQGGTVVPNKSTMVEDDEGEEDYEYRTGVPSGRFSHATHMANEKDKETIRNQEAELAKIKEEVESLQGKLLDREQELENVRDSGAERETGLTSERNEWFELREDLEQKVSDAQSLNDAMRSELDLLKKNKEEDDLELDMLRKHKAEDDHELDMLRKNKAEDDLELDNARDQNKLLQHQLKTHQAEVQQLRIQTDSHDPAAGSDEQQRRIHILEEELATQEKLTNEVRQEAMTYLKEMREFSRQNDEAVEQEEKLAAQVARLERDNEDWRQRYARIKAQNKSLRASTIGLNFQAATSAGSLMRNNGLLSPDGLVKDVDVTHFQISVDDLLKAGRQTDTDAMIESVKQVTICVQSITSAIGTDGYPTPAPSPHSPVDNVPDMSVAKLKARVTGTANSLITATKQHATASGLSPVALLDAAASNLTASVVELIKAVGIRPSSKDELRDADLASFYDDRPSEDVDVNSLAPPSESASRAAPEVKPATGALGRSNTTKKANGWFNWGRGTSADDRSPSPSPVGNGHVSSDDEFDAYR